MKFLTLFSLAAVLGFGVIGSSVFSEEPTPKMPKAAEKTTEPPKPLVDDPEKLKPLDAKGEIWLSEDNKSVVFLGKVCLNKGPLEFFLCRENSKEYESVVSTTVKPYIIHAGLMVTGVEAGKPVQHTPEFVAPTGPVVEITVRWLDKEGKRQETNAKNWVQNAKTEKALESDWVFTGSLFRKMPNGTMSYLADSTGEIIGVANFPTVVLDLPILSSDKNESLLFQTFTKNIPEPGTPVTLILTPQKKRP